MNIKLLATSFLILFATLGAEINYEVQDIGTLQTHSSQAIALNNQGQILGWYNIDGTNVGKHYFVRDRDGTFHEISEDIVVECETISGIYSIHLDWRYLTDEGRAYGTLTFPNDNSVFYMWDKHNGIVELGSLPGKEVMAVNNNGQVLIKSVVVNENGKSVRRPVIWHNGEITKLNGLEGNLGIESEESYGLAMNNKGEVVGQSLVYLNYKNEIYKQVHAVKWTNGQAIDLHKTLPKTNASYAFTINDLGDFLIHGDMCGTYLSKKDEKTISFNHNDLKMTNTNYMYTTATHGHSGVYDKNLNKLIDNSAIANKIMYDTDSTWMNVIGIVSANDNREVIAQGKTIYGEEHAMLLTPVKPE